MQGIMLAKRRHTRRRELGRVPARRVTLTPLKILSIELMCSHPKNTASSGPFNDGTKEKQFCFRVGGMGTISVSRGKLFH